MQINQIAISEVIPYDRNPRNNQEAIAKVAASIEAFGFRQPIVVDSEMVIIAGHTRLEAAKSLGLVEIPVHIAEGLTPTQAAAYRLADNRTAEDAEWDNKLLAQILAELESQDFDLSLTGFNDADIASLLAEGDTDTASEWVGMPEFTQTDKTAYRSILVHFKDQAKVDEFTQLTGMTVTPKTRFTWFPEVEIETYVDKQYIDES